MIKNERSNQALYDVIHLMVSNAHKALKAPREGDSPARANDKALAAVWSEKFLERLEDALDHNRRVQATLQSDLNTGSWSVHMRAFGYTYTVDYRLGEFLFSTPGSVWYRVDMTDPSNPGIQRG